jgi:hypothetical protein
MMSHSRPFARLTGLIGALALVAAGFVGLTAFGSPAAHAANGVTVTVTPSTGLADGEVVHVVAKGFTPNAGLIAVLECGPQVADPAVGQAACNVPGVGLTSSDANGTAETDITVKTGQVGTDPSSTCPPTTGTDPCVIQAANVGDQTENASAPIYFKGSSGNPSADLRMPDKVANNNAPATTARASTIGVTVDSGSAPRSNLVTTLSLTLPNGIDCADVTITADPHSPDAPPVSPLTSSSPTSPCTYDLGQDFLSTQKTYLYDISVDGRHPAQPPTTGTIDGTLSIYQDDANGNYVSTLATDSDSSQLTAPSAPSFNAALTQAPALYHRYSYKLANDPGVPVTPADPSAAPTNVGYAAFGAHQNADGSYDYIGKPINCTTTNGKQSCVIVLGGHGYGGHFQFNATTGTIESVDTRSPINPDPYWTWTIVANNGEGGAGASDTTNGPSNGKPQVLLHDVDSDPFTLPVLFGDVPTSNQFASEIYSLALQDVILGYGDGNFKATTSIHRQEFATFEMRVLEVLGMAPGQDTKDGKPYHEGPCLPGETSGYSDVSVNNQFCEQIRQLSRAGIIKGFTDSTFRPKNIVRRQEIAGLLFRADSYLKGAQVGDALCQTPTPFNDVSADNVFCGDIEWLTNHDITKGYKDGGFHPKAATLRQEGAAFFYRFGNLEQAGTFADPFSS